METFGTFINLNRLGLDRLGLILGGWMEDIWGYPGDITVRSDGVICDGRGQRVEAMHAPVNNYPRMTLYCADQMGTGYRMFQKLALSPYFSHVEVVFPFKQGTRQLLASFAGNTVQEQ